MDTSELNQHSEAGVSQPGRTNANVKGGGGMEIGLYTFGDLLPDPHTGRTISAQQRLEEIVAAARLADEAGLDIFGVGEHHRPDFAVSATPVVLAAIAQATQRIRLTSAVTILSSSDPVRVFEDFATVDLLSHGRAEITAGRGAFTESFPLFGYSLDDYDCLFSEKLDLLVKLSESERISWRGRFRTALEDAAVAPRPVGQLPIWVGVGGAPESAARAGALGLPMMLAIIGGELPRIAHTFDVYRQAAAAAGHDAAGLQVGVASHCYLADSTEQALAELYPYYSRYLGYFLGARGRIGPAEYQQLTSRTGAVVVGSPQQVVDKIMYEYELFGHQRFIAQIDLGGVPFAKVARAIELLATEVAPVVRRETGRLPGRRAESLQE